jgi:hypothetical protein
MHGLFMGLHHSHQIRSAEKSAGRAASRAAEAKRDARWLEDRVDRLTLVCAAMWELVRDRTELTEADLLAKVEEVDLRDGQADGKIKRVKRCPKCDRVMNPRHAKCLYCGADDLSATAFDTAL